jgi:hypothetical protein
MVPRAASSQSVWKGGLIRIVPDRLLAMSKIAIIGPVGACRPFDRLIEIAPVDLRR